MPLQHATPIKLRDSPGRRLNSVRYHIADKYKYKDNDKDKDIRLKDSPGRRSNSVRYRVFFLTGTPLKS